MALVILSVQLVCLLNEHIFIFFRFSRLRLPGLFNDNEKGHFEHKSKGKYNRDGYLILLCGFSAFYILCDEIC
jgi:hypothetical protein